MLMRTWFLKQKILVEKNKVLSENVVFSRTRTSLVGKRKIKRFINLKLFDDLIKFLASWLGHAMKADSFNLVNLFKRELLHVRD